MCVFLLVFFYKNYKKVKVFGVMLERNFGCIWFESFKYYVIEFDVFGFLFIIVGLVLFFLFFNIYFYQVDGWVLVICIVMFVVGFVFCVVFVVYEKWWVFKIFIFYEFFIDWIVFGVCIFVGNLFIFFYIWNSFFGFFFQVVSGLDIIRVSYIQNIYSIGFCFWLFVVGVLICWIGWFKWLVLYFGVFVIIFGVVFMVVFCQLDFNIGYIVMCQIFIVVFGGMLVICEQMVVMVVIIYQYIVVVLVIEVMFVNVGGVIGGIVVIFIWGIVFFRSLNKFLFEVEKVNVLFIFFDFKIQFDYLWGSEMRIVI